MNNTRLNKKLCMLGACFLAATLAGGAWYGRVFLSLPDAPEHTSIIPSPRQWPPERELDDFELNGGLFRIEQDDLYSRAGPLGKRFRLAGTFLAVSGNRHSRRAVIDVLPSGLQKMVTEGDMLDQGVVVGSVFRDRVVLREGQDEEEIWLSFSDAGRIGEDPDHPGAITELSDETTLLRFGKRVGERRWVLNRDSVLEYYKELLDDTERLANVFASMRPIYERESIQGYLLDIQGEGRFFNAFGLKQGDVVRSVNSMPMTSRFRAEYFIREFVANRANAFVFDIERGGNAERLIYMVR